MEAGERNEVQASGSGERDEPAGLWKRKLPQAGSPHLLQESESDVPPRRSPNLEGMGTPGFDEDSVVPQARGPRLLLGSDSRAFVPVQVRAGRVSGHPGSGRVSLGRWDGVERCDSPWEAQPTP